MREDELEDTCAIGRTLKCHRKLEFVQWHYNRLTITPNLKFPNQFILDSIYSNCHMTTTCSYRYYNDRQMNYFSVYHTRKMQLDMVKLKVY